MYPVLKRFTSFSVVLLSIDCGMYLSENQKRRLENKKRKLVALVNLFKLNDKDNAQVKE